MRSPVSLRPSQQLSGMPDLQDEPMTQCKDPSPQLTQERPCHWHSKADRVATSWFWSCRELSGNVGHSWGLWLGAVFAAGTVGLQPAGSGTGHSLIPVPAQSQCPLIALQQHKVKPGENIAVRDCVIRLKYTGDWRSTLTQRERGGP